MTDSHFGGGNTNPLSPNQYARPGYTFGGWSRTPGSSTTDFTDGQPVTNVTTSDGTTVTLYAVWVPATPAVLHDPPVQKIITGGTPHNAGTFTFLLRAVNTTAPEAAGVLPMPLAAGGNQEMQLEIQGAGTGEFGDISFRLPGTYVYEISELPIGRRGFSFDSDPVTVTYVVTQTGSVLNATRTMEKRGQTVTKAVFTNEFEKPNYIVSFDGNGAWRPFESQTVREGRTASEPIRKPVRSYGKFIGWYLDGQPYDFSQPVYDDITLFAMYDDSDSDNTSGGSGGGRGGSSSRGNGRSKHIAPTPSVNIATTPTPSGDSDTTDKLNNADPNRRAANTDKTEKLDSKSGGRRKKQTSGDKKRKRRLPKTGEVGFTEKYKAWE